MYNTIYEERKEMIITWRPEGGDDPNGIELNFENFRRTL
jgi:hypothetical protein